MSGSTSLWDANASHERVALEDLTVELQVGVNQWERAPGKAQRLLVTVEMFRHRGRVVLNDDEIFEEPDWACTFVGQGEKPLHHSIIVDQASDAEVLAQVAKIARVMQSAVQTLPPHHAYLERYLA